MSIYTTYSAYPRTIVTWIYMSIYTTYSLVPSYYGYMLIYTTYSVVSSYHGYICWYIQHTAHTLVASIYMLIYTTYSVIPSYHGYICWYIQHIASYPRTMDIYVNIYNIQRVPSYHGYICWYIQHTASYHGRYWMSTRWGKTAILYGPALSWQTVDIMFKKSPIAPKFPVLVWYFFLRTKRIWRQTKLLGTHQNNKNPT